VDNPATLWAITEVARVALPAHDNKTADGVRGGKSSRECGTPGSSMKFGISTLVTDEGIAPAELGRTLEERGFDSLFITEHTHIPASRELATLAANSRGSTTAHSIHSSLLPRSPPPRSAC
jgi:hypothetical protein